MAKIHCKLYLRRNNHVKEIRRIELDPTSSWEDMTSLIPALFGVDSVGLQYQDPEGDRICMSSQPEWEECLRIATYDVESPLRMHVACGRRRPNNEPSNMDEDGVEVVPSVSTDRPPQLEPEAFYMEADTGVDHPDPDRLQRVQETITSCLKRIMPSDMSIPSFLSTSVKVSNVGHERQVDVTIPALADDLQAQALRLLDQKDVDKALQLMKEASILKPSANILYNLACCLALKGDLQSSMRHLQQAIENGYDNVSHLEQDDDLAQLRETPEYIALLGQLRATFPPSPPSTPLTTPAAEEPVAAKPEEATATAQVPATTGEVKPTTEDKVAKWVEEIRKLRAMGFYGEERAIEALERNKGNLARVVDEMLS
eukprot:NODE_2192_length_1255_cov_101.707447_g2084_i0.p1 GENE.NODE_2192_length_1255_cov_101.707447_g2084_i0~~NODE_2192_length_1255_cov_101.707447_g2084_i0.p1  ORF type:complete len:371 (+),score=75.44 NODE_2192_length_1255_cov_101.707447_g2084_i0:60-1172(+)